MLLHTMAPERCRLVISWLRDCRQISEVVLQIHGAVSCLVAHRIF
jgi:hypothetical protein